MIGTTSFELAEKIFKAGIIINAGFYYSRRKKTRHASENLPRGIRDFHKIYVPAPELLELVSRLPKTIKRDKKSKYTLAMWFDYEGTFCIGYCLEHFIDETLYEYCAVEPADAAASLILKLKKDGKLKI